MGKAAERRRIRRQEFLRRLSMEDHKRFEHEWGKRLESWSAEIREKGRMGQISGLPLFRIADYAKEILVECGPAASILQYKATDELLNNECCRALTYQAGKELYRLNQNWHFDDKYRKSRKKAKKILTESK